MAKKAKTPPPPRRPVQAPQQRSTPRAPGESRKWSYLVWFACAGILLLAGVLALLAISGGDESASGGLMKTTYCEEEDYPGLNPRHVANPDAKVNYNSFPPSSGPHFQSPAPWGIYEDPIKQTILVHNLEHGGIVLQYGDVGEETVREIQSFYQDDPYGLVVAPYPRLGKGVALTAWNEPRYARNQSEPGDVDAGNGYVLTCTQWDEDAAADFRDKRRNKAGERFGSIEDMRPGT